MSRDASQESSEAVTCVERDILIPLGSNTVVIDNEQHTMSMVVFFLQVNPVSLEKGCILGKNLWQYTYTSENFREY